MVFVYKVTATCNIEKIPRNKRDKVLEKMDDINADIFNEHFYYGINEVDNSNGFIPSYHTDIEFDFDIDQHSYSLSYICYNEKDNMMDYFKTMHKDVDFDLDEIFCRSGDDDIYTDLGLHPITTIKGSIRLEYDMWKGNADDEDDYACLIDTGSSDNDKNDKDDTDESYGEEKYSDEDDDEYDEDYTFDTDEEISETISDNSNLLNPKPNLDMISEESF